jgi:hypothetical protein
MLSVRRTKEIKEGAKRGQFTFDGPVDKNQPDSGHAMLLVGMTFVPSEDGEGGKWWFYVQNWWSKQQHIEMSLEFLQQIDAYIKFPKDLQ